ncbi:MAG: hypothetical protein JWR80_7544 [Bradyrhizobium sp.]|nr:hypothetical protein [Bradyrhizobium sp.]
MAVERYRDQVRLLLDILPLVATEQVFALKGGTAINLFEQDMPRLSVDIDLTYLPNEPREHSLAAIREALGRIKLAIEARLARTRVTHVRQGDEDMEVKLLYQRGRTQVKIEANPTIRGHVWPVRQLACSHHVQEEFEAFIEASVVSHGELFGGKICAALDRQHPRDLFDVKLLLDQEGLTEDVRRGMIVGLVGHNRPISELLASAHKNQEAAFKAQFDGMARIPFGYDDHVETLDRLVQAIRQDLTPEERRFLLSFESGDPDWERMPLAGLDSLPAPQFKLRHIRHFRETAPDRHALGLKALRDVLN